MLHNFRNRHRSWRFRKSESIPWFGGKSRVCLEPLYYTDMTVREQKQVSPEVLDDVVHRVVAAADPERIMMFGSAARGAMRPDSDLDLLVIKAGRYEYHRVISDIYKSVA